MTEAPPTIYAFDELLILGPIGGKAYLRGERKPTLTECYRCGSTDFHDTPIHAGRSLRRDCARCGRTWGFPKWAQEERASG